MNWREEQEKAKYLAAGFDVIQCGSGFPDLLVLKDGVPVEWVEVKSAWDRVRENQAKMQSALRAIGIPGRVVIVADPRGVNDRQRKHLIKAIGYSIGSMARAGYVFGQESWEKCQGKKWAADALLSGRAFVSPERLMRAIRREVEAERAGRGSEVLAPALTTSPTGGING